MDGLFELAAGPMRLEFGVFGLLLLVLIVGIGAGGRAGGALGWVTLTGLTALAAASFVIGPTAATVFDGAFVVDDLSLFAKRLFLSSAAVSVLATLGWRSAAMPRRSTEYFAALLASLLGMLIVASARDLVTFFVAFELMSIPLYFLAGFEKRSARAPEGALKFFLVGSVSSAVMLYGISFLYGAAGGMDMAAIAPAVAAGSTLAVLGLTLVFAGLGFKIAAVPFHMWVPDTYEGAGAPFVAWLSVAPKAAGFIAIFRIYVERAGDTALLWLPTATALATVTIVAGNLMAIPQLNIKRLLGYSGVAHIGYLLIGLAVMSTAGAGMVLFYLVAYLFGNMGAFFVVQAVGQSADSDEIEAYRGLARRAPALALALLVFLLSLGGIPFMAGFWAKLFIFWAAVDAGMYWLAFLGAVATIVALYYYLVVAKRMYIDEAPTADRVPVPAPLLLAILFCMAGVLLMGVYPEPWVRASLSAVGPLFPGS